MSTNFPGLVMISIYDSEILRSLTKKKNISCHINVVPSVGCHIMERQCSLVVHLGIAKALDIHCPADSAVRLFHDV